MKWSGKFGAAQLVLGDFDLTPQEPELQPMLTMFQTGGPRRKPPAA